MSEAPSPAPSALPATGRFAKAAAAYSVIAPLIALLGAAVFMFPRSQALAPLTWGAALLLIFSGLVFGSSIDDGWLTTLMSSADQWNNLPGSYHNGACNFCFADGHIELHKWRDALTCHPISYTRIAAEISDPGSPAIQWMHDHTSVPLP